MRLSFVPLSVAAWFALGAPVATAAPAPNSGGPKPQVQCPVPDAAKCIEEGYIDGVCGKKHLAVCLSPVQAAMQGYHDTTVAPKIKMLRPKLSEMPKHVASGKYYAYKKRLHLKKQGAPPTVDKIYRKAGDVLAGIAGMDMSSTAPVDRVTKIDPNEAIKFWRDPTWKSNGYAIKNCKEYAYARSFNAARFIDAASACRGDSECVFRVAYLGGSSKIAQAKLYDESGHLMSRQLTLPTGKFQKNDMFAEGMDEFIKVPSVELPNGMIMQVDEVAALKNALKFGNRFYELGLCTGAGCNNKTRFKDVWDWHKYLHGRTVALSQNEAEEYERRRAKFRALLEQWQAAVAWERSLGKGMIQEQELVLPFDMRAFDPFERYTHEREYIERGRLTRQDLTQRFGAALLNKSRAVAIPQMRAKKGMQGAFQRSGAAMAAGLFAAPAQATKPTPSQQPTASNASPTGAGSVGALEHSQAYASDVPEVSKCFAPEGWGFEAMYNGPISCRIQEFLLGEWRRKAAGQKSCLDLGNPDCDWTPQMFEAGVLAQVQRLDVLVSDEEYCDAYAESGDFAAADANANHGQWNLVVLTQILSATEARVKKELKAVGQYRLEKTTKGQKLGKDWAGGDFVGDKDWFAAGYEYGLGWGLEPTKKEGTEVCQIAGSVHGDLGFDAWLAGAKIPVVAGEVRADSKPGNANVSFTAHLEMMDQTVFQEDGWLSAQPFAPSSDYGVQVPGGLKPRFDIFVGVLISGELWGELLFGASLQLKGAVSAACKSEVKNPKFAISAQYMPFFGAFGVGQVGVGIAGVASAGIRASLNLIMLSLPLDISMGAGMKLVDGKSTPVVSFASELNLMLSTLSGRVSLYVEFLMFDEEFELFRWQGFHTEVPLMPKLIADVSFTGLR